MGDNKRAGGAAAAVKSKAAKTDGQICNDAHTFFSRMAAGKVAKATDEQKADAKAGLEVYKSLNKDERVLFAKKLQDSKTSKSFGWVKDFKQSISKDRVDKNKVVAKYMTRKAKTFPSWEFKKDLEWIPEESLPSVTEASLGLRFRIMEMMCEWPNHKDVIRIDMRSCI